MTILRRLSQQHVATGSRAPGVRALAISLALALPGGIPLPSPGLVPWILVVGLTGLTAHYALTSALSWAPASVVAPMEFIRLPVLATLGMLVYGEPFDPVVFLGAGAIVLGNLVNLRGERTRTAA